MQNEDNKLLGTAKEYIDLMKASGLSYFRIKNEDFEIELGEKHPPMPMMPPPPFMPGQMQGMQGIPGQPVATPAGAQPFCPSADPAKPGNAVTSPIVGTFYAAPSPEKPPYVTVGKQVHKGDVLFIIESMKLMNEVTSDFDGTVTEIFVEDGETVEFGEPIMCIE